MVSQIASSNMVAKKVTPLFSGISRSQAATDGRAAGSQSKIYGESNDSILMRV
jgi:hypothetical protein